MAKLNTKHKGDFYTPKVLADWMVFYLSKYFTKPIEVLEPSCGNGIFIDSLNKSKIPVLSFDGVELDKAAIASIQPAQNILNIRIYNDDFLYWETQSKYNLIIGNPPYIVRKRLRVDQASRCKEIHKEHSLLNHEVANIWTSFLLKAEAYLKDDGVLAFVLPTEILQVKYAKEIRTHLAIKFSRLEVITFKHLAFDNI